jgi:transcriptional activator for dhaKLM operon
VRELENMLERVTYLMPGTTITIADLPIDVQQVVENNQTSSIRNFDSAIQTQKSLHELHHAQPLVTEQGTALKEQSMNAEMQAIIKAWDASNGHITRAAALLGISRTTMWRKMVKYGLTEGKDNNS